eukprot:SAG25_NODE_6824_length_527_cov_0.845794_2_plen_76_part_01
MQHKLAKRKNTHVAALCSSNPPMHNPTLVNSSGVGGGETHQFFVACSAVVFWLIWQPARAAARPVHASPPEEKPTP